MTVPTAAISRAAAITATSGQAAFQHFIKSDSCIGVKATLGTLLGNCEELSYGYDY